MVPGLLFGAFLGSSGDLLGSLGGPLGSLWPSLGALGVSLGPLGASFGVPRVVLGVIFHPLGLFWVSFRVPGRFQGTSGAYFKDLFDRLHVYFIETWSRLRRRRSRRPHEMQYSVSKSPGVSWKFFASLSTFS